LDNVAIPSIAGDPLLGQEDHGRAAARGAHRNERQGWCGKTGTVSPPQKVPTSVQKMQKGGKEEAKRGIALFTAPLSLPDATQAQITNRTV